MEGQLKRIAWGTALWAGLAIGLADHVDCRQTDRTCGGRRP